MFVNKIKDMVNKLDIIEKEMILSLLLFILGISFHRIKILSFIFYLIGYIVIGHEVLFDFLKNIKNKKFFDENTLMTIATICAFIIGKYSEALMVMLLFEFGEYIGDKAVNKSKDSIIKLMNLKSNYANLIYNNKSKKVDVEKLNIDDEIIVKPGERIPVDGIIIDGKATIDLSSLTGESTPKLLSVNDSVISGSINLSGVIRVRVTKVYEESTATRILKLIEEADNKKAPTEKFITKFSKYYTPIIVMLAFLIFIIPVLLKQDIYTWSYKALVFLVLSCPCALVISIPLGFFCGIGICSKKGLLIKGSNILETLKNADAVIFDKTGTLTKGNFNVISVNPVSLISKEELIELASYAEAYSNHPIALSILSYYNKKVSKKHIKEYEEIAGKGIKTIIGDSTILIGNKELLEDYGIKVKRVKENGTIIYIASDKKYLGYIVIADEIKENSKQTIEGLRKLGLNEIIMLSGDNKVNVENVAKELEIYDYSYELLPEDKAKKIESFKNLKYNNIIFVGDGINDAPVLALSDIGVSMGGIGSDAAIEASDIVIMDDNPNKLVTAIKIAKKVNNIVVLNIVFAIFIKILVLILGIFGISTIWMAVFADVGVTILSILNVLRIMKYKDY